jgi:hypothetical protein
MDRPRVGAGPPLEWRKRDVVKGGLLASWDDDIPEELRPLFEVCFILGWGICSSCGREEPFESIHKEFSDEWWIDESRAMKNAGWIVVREQETLCPECASRPGAAT